MAAQNARVKVHTPANMLERRFGVWLGELPCSVAVLVLLIACIPIHAARRQLALSVAG